ncbi:MAG: ribonuclease H-like domain-containing protein, partial [Candidatus Limnocylindria bacterium]
MTHADEGVLAAQRERGGGPPGTREHASTPESKQRRAQRPCFTTTEQRIAIDDLGLEIVGRGAPDPLLLAHLGLRGAPPERWEDILFLDTETTGLAGGTGTYVFLLGTAYLAGGELVLRQHVLHDLGAERSFVAALLAELDRFRACASYNGKCFDLPLLRTRVILALRAQLTVDDSHLDLLHPARRLWRGRFGSTGLRQLEDSVLDEPRVDDIPGALIPERYFAFLRTRDEGLLAPILEHNLRDIVSLVRIADHVARAVLQARRGRAPD